jgi:hypothetical protein
MQVDSTVKSHLGLLVRVWFSSSEPYIPFEGPSRWFTGGFRLPLVQTSFPGSEGYIKINKCVGIATGASVKILEVDLDWTDKTDQKPPTPLFKGEVRLDDKKKKKERQVAETMVKAGSFL